MEVFDYVSMAVGSLLIVIGLFLFISGKKDSAKSNQVEGFGIKLNVSNPSIILIVLGIGLLLVPRLLPKPTVTPGTQPTQAAADSPVTKPPTQAEFNSTEVIAAPKGWTPKVWDWYRALAEKWVDQTAPVLPDLFAQDGYAEYFLAFMLENAKRVAWPVRSPSIHKRIAAPSGGWIRFFHRDAMDISQECWRAWKARPSHLRLVVA